MSQVTLLSYAIGHLVINPGKMYAAYTYPEELKTIRAVAATARLAAVSRKSGTALRVD